MFALVCDSSVFLLSYFMYYFLICESAFTQLNKLSI